MRILLIEDTRAGVTETVARLSPFGEVRAARSIAEAKEVIATGFRFDAIVTDFNLGDGRSWRDTVRDAVDISAGRPIAAHTADLYPELREEFARLFSGRVEIFSKREPHRLVQWLQQFRRDQSGRVVQTMDRGSDQSHRDIREEVIDWLHDLGFPQPAEYHLRRLIEWWLKWQRRLMAAWDTAAKVVIGLLVTGAATLIISALWGQSP